MSNTKHLLLKPRTLISLEEMTRFFLKRLLLAIEELEQERVGVAPHEPMEKKQRIALILKTVEDMAFDLEMVETHGRCSHFRTQLELDLHEVMGRFGERMNHSQITSELDGLLSAISNELYLKKFAYIPADKSSYFERDDLFGKQVTASFPSAKNDIRDVGNCIAADLNTAAVFHLMRVVEFGLRAFAGHLKVKLKNTPLEYAQWQTVLLEIEAKIKMKIPVKMGKKKSEALEFYNGVWGEFNGFKDVWRNNVMHARRSYNAMEAIGAYQRVQDFMRRLSERVSEVK